MKKQWFYHRRSFNRKQLFRIKVAVVSGFMLALLLALSLAVTAGATREITRVSTVAGGSEGNGWSNYPAISADGGYVAFNSDASKLVPDDANGVMDVFLATAFSEPDTTPPTPPADLQANTISDSRIDLYWSAATDNVGVTGYHVFRSTDNVTFSEAATTGGLAYSDTGLLPGQTYYYYVIAEDGAANLSDPSDTASDITLGAPDTEPPTPPADLVATAVSDSRIDLSWSAATDNVGVTGYHVFRSTDNVTFEEAATTTGLTYSDTGLLPAQTYYYYVIAEDAADNLSDPSDTASDITLGAPDTEPPTPPGDLVATAVSESRIDLDWSASTDNVGVTGYRVYRSIDNANFDLVGSPAGLSYSDTGLQPVQIYYYYVMAQDGSGNLSAPSETAQATTLDDLPVIEPRPYYFTWYDNAGGSNWVLMSNPVGAGELTFTLSINGQGRSLAPYNNGLVGGGQTITPSYAGVQGGPVVATSQTGGKAIVSQRILWPKGGNSLEEVLGTETARLSSHFYWSWYDQSAGSGFKNWILVANPQSQTVYYRIKIAGQVPAAGTGAIAAGNYVTPQFPDMIGGPVEMEAWYDSVGGSQPAKVMASQRVLSNADTAFNEEVGIPAEELSDHYLWTWYDDVEGKNWMLVANPDPANEVTYTIKIGGQAMPGYSNRTLAPGAKDAPRFGVQAGPVELTSAPAPGSGGNGKVLASQRVLWGPSFEETPGYDFNALSSSYHWTWYDQTATGVTNWVLVANPSDSDSVRYQVLLGGQEKASGMLTPGGKATPSDLGIGGPVEVRAWINGGNWNNPTDRREVMASQRVIWMGYFNEVLGTVLEQ